MKYAQVRNVNSLQSKQQASQEKGDSQGNSPASSVSPKFVNTITRQLIGRVRELRWVLTTTIAVNVLSGALLIIQSYALARIVNTVFLFHGTLFEVRKWFWVILFLIAVRLILSWISQVFAKTLAIRVKSSLREQLIQHLLQLGPSFTFGAKRGEILNTAMTGIEQLEDFLAKYLPQMALSVLLPLVFLVCVLTQDWLTALLLAGTAPLIVLFMILVGKLAESASDRQWRQLGLISAWLLDLLQGLTTLKLFGRSKAQVEWMGRASESYRTATMRTLRVAFLSSFLLELFATLGTAVVAVSLGLRLISAHLSFLTAFFVLLLTPEFYQPLRLLGSEFHAGLNGVVAAQSIFEILDTKPTGLTTAVDTGGSRTDVSTEGGSRTDVPSMPERYPAETQAPIQEQAPTSPQTSKPFHGGALTQNRFEFGAIELRNVTFAYDDNNEAALKDITLTIRPGERVAIVGPSGSGKSTLLDVVQGFLTPTSGEILVNGTPLHRWSARDWRQQLAVLRQHSHLFSASIQDNILMARPQASKAELEQAAALAQAHHFITELDAGYATVVGEGGTGLSGGQIQRIAIARALLKDAPLLLLDEPASHLDAATEQLLERGLNQLMKNRTVMVAAHRFSTVRTAANVVVLQGGRVVQQGRHEQLLRTPGLYQQLYHSQWKGDTVDDA